MIDSAPPRELSPSEINALPIRAWLRHRFGLGHRLALVTLAVDLGLYAIGLDMVTAGNVVQAFVLLIIFPMSLVSLIYGLDAAVAAGHRLRLTSRAGLMPPRAQRLKELDSLEQQGPVQALRAGIFREIETEPDPGRRLGYVLAIPAGMAVVAVFVVLAGPNVGSGLPGDLVGEILAVVATVIAALIVAAIRSQRGFRNSSPDVQGGATIVPTALAELDARLAAPAAGPHAVEPMETAEVADSTRTTDR